MEDLLGRLSREAASEEVSFELPTVEESDVGSGLIDATLCASSESNDKIID